MKKIHKIYKIHVFIVMLLIASSGCQEINDLDLAPTDNFTELNYWTSPEKARMVLNTAYNQMTNSNYFFYNEGLSDNAFIGRGDPENVKTISEGQHTPATPRFDQEWDDRYAGIKTCNIFLENVDNVPDMDTQLRKRMKAEARFIRAWQYFKLANWFRDVPLFTKPIELDKSKNIEQTSHDEVIEFVHNELEDIKSDLPVKSEYSKSQLGRITKGAAIALNARVYLYNSDWENTVSSCERLMNLGEYSLFPSYEGIFLPQNEYNSEVILDHQYVPIDRTYNNLFDLAPLSIGARINTMAPTQELVDSYLMSDGQTIDESPLYDENNPYENRDPRLSATIVHHGYEWVKDDGSTQTIYIEPGSAPDDDAARDEYAPGSSNSTSTGYYLRKYYDPQSEEKFQSGLNLILIRYADVLLMYAEAKNELGEMNQTVWNNTIKALRERAGFTDAAALNYDSSWGQDQLRQIIRRERRVELAMEGLRIYDIRRWKTAEDVLDGYPHGAMFGEDGGHIRLTERTFDPSKHYWWPIPRAELDLNSNLEQPVW